MKDRKRERLEHLYGYPHERPHHCHEFDNKKELQKEKEDHLAKAREKRLKATEKKDKK